MHSDPNLVYIIFAGLAALLVIIPLPKAIVSGNVGTSMLILWIVSTCLLQFSSAIRWNHNIINWAPAWCDFCAHFLIAADVALAGASLSINRRLYMIVTLHPRRQEKVYNGVVEFVFCLVIPLVSIALEYVVQQYRYYIYEDIGCIPGVGNVNLAFPLVWMLPLLLGVISTGYACLTIRASFIQNHSLHGEPGVNLGWSRRLMAIGIISALYGLVPTSMSIALLATAYPVAPWPGWDAIHSTIGDVIYVPAQEWRSRSITIVAAELRRWTIASLAFIVAVILGLTADAKKFYWRPFRSAIDQVFPTDQAGRAVFEQNMAIQSTRLHRNDCWIALEKSPSHRRRESFGSIDCTRLDPDVESIHLAFSVS